MGNRPAQATAWPADLVWLAWTPDVAALVDHYCSPLHNPYQAGAGGETTNIANALWL